LKPTKKKPALPLEAPSKRRSRGKKGSEKERDSSETYFSKTSPVNRRRKRRGEDGTDMEGGRTMAD